MAGEVLREAQGHTDQFSGKVTLPAAGLAPLGTDGIPFLPYEWNNLLYKGRGGEERGGGGG